MVAKFSESFRRRVSDLAAEGYFPYKAQVRFVVYWRYEETVHNEVVRKEIPVVLPDILFRKTSAL